MFTDMVGYTRASQADEARALRLREEQEALLRPLLAAHRGREVKSIGDGSLVEFSSALDAVRCAIEIQRRLQERNATPGTEPIDLRIGIHLGDVEPRGDDIFGDSVNIAARIEPLAEPGGICISEPVFGQVHNKISDPIEPLGPRVLKNVQSPMELYRVVVAANSPGESPRTEGRPAGLAVLPFANISPDPNDAYFADGLTEELISVLSQLNGLRVIARTSVLPYRSTTKGAAEIGRDLGVASLLQGSVRKAGQQLRITVQLIDVASQGHLWSTKYDRELVDVFAIQSEIAREVAEALRVTLRATESARLATLPTVRPDSYLAYLKGRVLLRDRTASALAAAREQFELSVRLDPRNASAYSGLADVAMLLGIYVGSRSAGDIEASRTYAKRALELDPDLAEAHASLGHALTEELDFAAAEQEFQRAVALNPSYATAHHWYSLLLQCQDRREDALREMARAEEGDPLSVATLAASAHLLIRLRRMEEASAKIEKLGAVENFGDRYHLALHEYRMAERDWPRALEELERLARLSPHDPALAPGYAFYFASTGQRDRALERVGQIEATAEGIPFKKDILAGVFALLGELDESFRLLAEAVRDRSIVIRTWRLDPRYEPLRADPRFTEILRQLKLA